MKLPKRLKFPGGFIVKIKQKRPDFFAFHGATAMWDEDRVNGGTIRLDRTRKRRKLRADLRHEFDHVFADWVDYYLKRLK